MADLIISEGLSFNIPKNPILKKVLELERYVSNNHIHPDRKLIYKELLDVIHAHTIKSNLAMIKK